jgi:hypothetical protein
MPGCPLRRSDRAASIASDGDRSAGETATPRTTAGSGWHYAAPGA